MYFHDGKYAAINQDITQYFRRCVTDNYL